MISEGSWDTEDWSNDPENSALITAISDILKYITIENSYFQLQYYFTILQFYCIFNQINAALVSIKDFFQKH